MIQVFWWGKVERNFVSSGDNAAGSSRVDKDEDAYTLVNALMRSGWKAFAVRLSLRYPPSPVEGMESAYEEWLRLK